MKIHDKKIREHLNFLYNCNQWLQKNGKTKAKKKVVQYFSVLREGSEQAEALGWAIFESVLDLLEQKKFAPCPLCKGTFPKAKRK